jgi:hypothetical protein
MIKKLSICLILILSLVLVSGFAYAQVTGRCDNCHTMHNSQNGARMADQDTPYAHLTKSSCLGCHGAAGSVVGGAPNVFTAVGAADRTAGGTFKATVVDAAAGDYHKVHNVTDITWTIPEVELLNATPGAESGGYTEPAGASQLTCAGTLGCHGEHGAGLNSDAGIRGFHHGGKTGYRYLQFFDGGTTHTPILGKGSSDWEKGGATSGNHNVYFAMNGINGATNDSINALCALCHGDFHGGTDVQSGSNWIRHPTENLLSAASGWNMASVTVDYENNPFSFNGSDYTSAAPTTAYTTTGARVACISCHRAHGTANNDILRWDYATMTAGGSGTTGCLGCHHLQR